MKIPEELLQYLTTAPDYCPPLDTLTQDVQLNHPYLQLSNRQQLKQYQHLKSILVQKQLSSFPQYLFYDSEDQIVMTMLTSIFVPKSPGSGWLHHSLTRLLNHPTLQTYLQEWKYSPGLWHSLSQYKTQHQYNPLEISQSLVYDTCLVYKLQTQGKEKDWEQIKQEGLKIQQIWAYHYNGSLWIYFLFQMISLLEYLGDLVNLPFWNIQETVLFQTLRGFGLGAKWMSYMPLLLRDVALVLGGTQTTSQTTQTTSTTTTSSLNLKEEEMMIPWTLVLETLLKRCSGQSLVWLMSLLQLGQ